jgi:hypothetical protein
MRNRKISYLLAAAVLLLLTSLASVANACTCGGGSPCEAYASASVVFVGQVTRTGLKAIPRSLPDNAMSTTLTDGGVMSAQFKVEEAFLGIKAAQIEILGQGTTCDFPFKSGERYLVFAYKDSRTGTVHTNICAGTASLAESNDNLAYIRKAAKQPAGAAFSGEVVREVYGGPEPRVEPMANTEIILENGKGQLRGVTDASGKFELLGIKPGRYRVHTNPVTNFSRLDPMAKEPRNEWEVDIPTHGCVQTWFAARPKGEI